MTNKHISFIALFNYNYLLVIFKLVLNIEVGYIVTHLGYHIPSLTSHFNMEVMGISHLLAHLIWELCITSFKVVKAI